MNRRAVLASLVALAAAPALAQTHTPRRCVILYLEREDDPLYQRSAGPDGEARDPADPPYPGAALGIHDAGPIGRAAGIDFVLDRQTIPADADIAAAATQFVAQGIYALIADVPAADLIAIARALPPDGPAVFNIRESDDTVRATLCGRAVFHVAPSLAQQTDALAQFVVRKNWKRVLVLFGPLADDKVLADRFQASARKFGARIVDARQFVYGNDPRRREQTNIALLSGDAEYDVMFVADTARDFGRFVEYQQLRPRPVLGTAGLVAAAWHAQDERFGAPQVNHRFTRTAHRPMTDADWAAWVAVHAVVEAVASRGAASPSAVTALLAGDLQLDVGKGQAVSFRPWDHQLRQPILLTTADAVIASAPLEGFEHPVTDLDTLGLGPQETACGR